MSMQTSTDDSQRCRCRDCTGGRCPCCLASAAERGFALPADAIGDDMASEPYKNGYMLAVEQIAQLTADLAQAQARANALAIENAALRTACVSLVEFSAATGWQRWECHLCLAESSSREQLVHVPDCLLAADSAQRGAELLALADAMREAVLDVAYAVKQGPIGSVSEWRYLIRDAAEIAEARADAYRRLCGGRAPEGGAPGS